MKKLFVVVLLASASVVACGGKKANTTPTSTDPAMQKNGDPTGGATYGGQTGKTPTPADKDKPNASPDK
jgi:hypothetical protein